MTKQNQILRLIQQAGSKGINTNELRNITHVVDVPKAVSVLRLRKGHKILCVDNPDGSTTYIMENQKRRPIYAYEGNVAKIVGYQ
jgi:hypothetical protein